MKSVIFVLLSIQIDPLVIGLLGHASFACHFRICLFIFDGVRETQRKLECLLFQLVVLLLVEARMATSCNRRHLSRGRYQGRGTGAFTTR